MADPVTDKQERDFDAFTIRYIVLHFASVVGIWMFVAAAGLWTVAVLDGWGAAIAGSVLLAIYANRRLLPWLAAAGVGYVVLDISILPVMTGPMVYFTGRAIQVLLLYPSRIDSPKPSLSASDIATEPFATALIWRGDRRMKRFRVDDALIQYDHARLRANSNKVQGIATLRRCIALEALGRLQEALDAAQTAGEITQYMARDSTMFAVQQVQLAVILGQLGQLDTALRHVRSGTARPGTVPPGERVRRILVHADLERRLGHPVDAAALIRQELTSRVVRRDPRLLARCLYMLSRALEEMGDWDGARKAAETASKAANVPIATSMTNSKFVLFSRLGRLSESAVEEVPYRLRIAELEIEQSDARELEGKIGFRDDDATGKVAMLAGDRLRGAEAAALLALKAQKQGELEVADWYSSRALMVLDEARYFLRSQEHRRAWSAAMEQAGMILLAVTCQRTPEALLEIIESLRLQAVPKAYGEKPGRNGQQAEEIALDLPPAVILDKTPRTTLSRLKYARQVPLSIRETITRVARTPVCWFGTWSASDTLYWGMLGSDGHSSGGAIPFRSGSPAATAIAELYQALPLIVPKEKLFKRAVRLAKSPLWCDPAQEQRCTRQVASMLLPSALRSYIVTQSERGLRPCLLIAPSADVAHVPWGLLHLKPDEDEDLRVLEAADWLLAPSVALLSQVVVRPWRRPTGLGVVVLDPTGADTPVDAYEDLPLSQARELRTTLPADCHVLTGPWDHQSPNASVRNVSSVLKSAGRVRVAYFATHCAAAPAGRSADSALCLTPEPGSPTAARLSARDLLLDSSDDPRFPFPSEVVLSTCDSAGASAASGGEWLSLGPAALWAGADAAVVSVFPIIDDSALDAYLLQRANDPRRTKSLPLELLDYQRKALTMWRKGHRGSHAPIRWAGYGGLGRLHDDVDARGSTDSVVTIPGANSRTGNRRTWLSPSAITLIEKAGDTYLNSGPSEKCATTLDVAVAWLEDHDGDALNGALAATFHQLFCADLLAVELLRDPLIHMCRRREARSRCHEAESISTALAEVVSYAIDNAARSGRPSAHAEDVALAILKLPCAGRTFFRLVRYGQRQIVRKSLAITAEWTPPDRPAFSETRTPFLTRPDRRSSLISLGFLPAEYPIPRK